MINCRKCKDMMIEALYNERGPAEREAFEAHLSACPDCASDYSVLGATLRVMDERQRPDPGPGFWDTYWDRLSARLDRTADLPPEHIPLAVRVGRFFSGLPRWSYQAAAGAALVALGILIGRMLVTPPGRPSPLQNSAAGPGVMAVSNDPEVRARQYIERSQVLLLGLVNYDPKTQDLYGLDLDQKKAVSRELAVQAADIQGALTDPRQKRLRELVQDLQMIMMQIANLGAGNDLDGVELVKQGVERQGIFLKIDLTRMSSTAGGAPGFTARPGLGTSGRPKNPDKNKI
jgi:hypothetical protein